MNGNHSFRYDPLYRVIDETEEIRVVEGKLKQLYERLKEISNLGIIPEVFGMAKYPKYEHSLGTTHQVISMLNIVDKNIIPEKYRKPLILASLFLHLGHFPYTYSTERALLLACYLDNEYGDKRIKEYIEELIKKVLDKGNVDEKTRNKIRENVLSLRDYKLLYRFFSARILIENYRYLRNKIEGLSEGDLEIIIKDLIDETSDGYFYLRLADMADYVQRDALYFGTVRIEVSPVHLYGGMSRYEPSFSVSEEELIEHNLDYLTERFYYKPDIDWFDRLYEKIVASLIMSKKFKLEWLMEYNDSQFRRLICDGLDESNNKTKLPRRWLLNARKLFEKKYTFSPIFELNCISFKKDMNVLDIEYELVAKGRSKKQLLTYPFERGILISIEYVKDEQCEYPIHPNYHSYSMRVYQNESKRSLTEILKLIWKLTPHISLTHVEEIRKGIAKQFSGSNGIRFLNDPVIKEIANGIKLLENSIYQKGDFIERCLKDLSSILTFNNIWHNFETLFVWKGRILHLLQEHREEMEKWEIYEDFVSGLLSLPVRLLQYKSTKKYLDQLYDILLQRMKSEIHSDKKGEIFEALWLIDRIRSKNGKFQFFLNGMVVIDTNKPRSEQDENQFDVIELLINDDGNAECWIYECSIADDYKKKNHDKIFNLANSIHDTFPDLKIRTRYVIPNNKRDGDWSPRLDETGINFH
ncbi:MAG: hypothetical protein DRN40_04120 [Thermoplasmata archaeon]|nr:MAG: hypothetical protein DRN40_04120 [Thermoplasmata archaeon]